MNALLSLLVLVFVIIINHAMCDNTCSFWPALLVQRTPTVLSLPAPCPLVVMQVLGRDLEADMGVYRPAALMQWLAANALQPQEAQQIEVNSSHSRQFLLAILRMARRVPVARQDTHDHDWNSKHRRAVRKNGKQVVY